MACQRTAPPSHPRRASASLLATAALAACAQGPDVALDAVVQQAQETSLYAEHVDWPAVDREYRRLVGDAGSAEALQPGLALLINALGDKHGTARVAADGTPVAWYTGEVTAPPRPTDADFVREVMHDTSAEFSYERLEPDVGYLRVVGIGPGDVAAQAAKIREGLLALDRAGVQRWVLDLRFNGGGNFNPMLAGLAPLVGTGVVGGAVDARGDLVRRYVVEDGEFLDSGRRVAALGPEPRLAAEAPVAVLLSRYTISSGELVATAFKGRPNTRFFGERTAGYTTGTGYAPLGFGLVLCISESVFVDRDRNAYTDGVEADVPSVFVPGRVGDDDEQLSAALDWLRGR